MIARRQRATSGDHVSGTASSSTDKHFRCANNKEHLCAENGPSSAVAGAQWAPSKMNHEDASSPAILLKRHLQKSTEDRGFQSAGARGVLCHGTFSRKSTEALKSASIFSGGKCFSDVRIDYQALRA